MLCRKRCYRNMQLGDITIEELKNKLSQGAILLDVRSPQEYREGHLSRSYQYSIIRIRDVC